MVYGTVDRRGTYPDEDAHVERQPGRKLAFRSLEDFASRRCGHRHASGGGQDTRLDTDEIPLLFGRPDRSPLQMGDRRKAMVGLGRGERETPLTGNLTRRGGCFVGGGWLGSVRRQLCAEGTSQTGGLDYVGRRRRSRNFEDPDPMRVDCSKDSMPFRTDERSGKLEGFGPSRIPSYSLYSLRPGFVGKGAGKGKCTVWMDREARVATVHSRSRCGSDYAERISRRSLRVVQRPSDGCTTVGSKPCGHSHLPDNFSGIRSLGAFRIGQRSGIRESSFRVVGR